MALLDGPGMGEGAMGWHMGAWAPWGALIFILVVVVIVAALVVLVRAGQPGDSYSRRLDEIEYRLARIEEALRGRDRR